MKKINIIILLISLLFLGSNCNKEDDVCNKTITVINNSEKAIYVICETHYPDTLFFGHFSSPTLDSINNKILAKSSNNRSLLNRDCWEAVFNHGVQIPSDTLMVYVFDAEVLENMDWADIVHDYMVLKRYDLSLQDLERMNWTVEYP
jgi:hypothetical protein